MMLVMVSVVAIFFFFFQAEDGIRVHCVTGVQTCALPICSGRAATTAWSHRALAARGSRAKQYDRAADKRAETGHRRFWIERSEERRVGKSVDLGGRSIIKKKKERNYALGVKSRANADKRQ